MSFFIVTMTHPDGPGWGEHANAHVDYLKQLVAAGSLKASGPLTDGPGRAGFLIFKAPDREAVEQMVAQDPFAVNDLIVTLTIAGWDPLFGAFSGESSGRLAGLDPIA